MSDRKLGYTGKRIPTDRLTNVVRAVLAAQYGATLEDFENVRAEDSLLLTRIGEYGTEERRTIITEGVQGERLAGSNTIEVYCMQGSMSLTVPVGAPLLVELAQNGESVEVAEFVRVFGSRLDVNVSIAQRWMRGEDK